MAPWKQQFIFGLLLDTRGERLARLFTAWVRNPRKHEEPLGIHFNSCDLTTAGSSLTARFAGLSSDNIWKECVLDAGEWGLGEGAMRRIGV